MTDALRVEALRAALAIRTPGTSPEQTLALAQTFLDWLAPATAKQELATSRPTGQPPKR
jgi:hypothetical protein